MTSADQIIDNTVNVEEKKLKHPKGLYMLFFVEMWERFSYFGMRGILMLYLTKTFIEGGLGIDDSTASLIYGFFTGFVYFTPLIGGWLADKYLGQQKSIYIGCILMALGQFTLFSLNNLSGLAIGLILLIIGNGFFKPNISTLVGKLYSKDDPRKDSAFSIFYMGVNLGAFLAPIVLSVLTDGIFAVKSETGEILTHGYKYGFLAASIGMVLGYIIFASLSKKYLGDIGLKPSAQEIEKVNVVSEVKPVNSKLTSVEKQRVAVIFIYFFFAIFFFAGFEQAGSSLTLYTDKYIDRVVTLPFYGAFEIPTPVFQSVNPFFIVCLAPLFAILWGTKFGRSLSTPVKMGSGMVILGLGFFFMLGAVSERGGDIEDVAVKASLWWLVLTYLVHTIGELCLSPVGLSVVTKLSPPKLASVLMAVWMLSSFFANLLGGVLSSTVAALGAGRIFFYIAIFVMCCGVLMICLNKVLIRMMHGIR